MSADHGYRTGVHAPGLTDDAAAAAATHHLLLAHGLGAQALRSVHPATPVGITLDMHPVRLAADTQPELVEAARLATDAELNGLFLEPVLHGRYPEHVRASLLPPPDLIADGDFETIRQPIDFLGVNYYSPVFLRAGDPDDLRRDEEPARCELPGVVEYQPAELERTPMGWLVDADGLYDLLIQLSDAAPGLPLYITENGCAAEDYVDPDGDVKDVERDQLSAPASRRRRARDQGRREPGWLLRLVTARQLRVGMGLPAALRDHLRRLRDSATDP